jgi:hypothetical protein
MKLGNTKSIEEFTEAIEKLVKDDHCDYIDAILTYCEKNNLEIETAAKLVKNSPILKDNLLKLAKKLNLIKKHKK